MSVVTTYEIKAEKIVKKLKDTGAFKMKDNSYQQPVYEFDEKGYGHEVGKQTWFFADLDLSLLWPEDWKEYMKHIIEKGVLNVDTSLLERLDEHCVMEYMKRQMPRPELEKGMEFGCYAVRDGVCGYTCNTFEPGHGRGPTIFREFDVKKQAEIKEGAERLSKMWKKIDDDHLRRDLTEYELQQIATYPVRVNENGSEIVYSRNYAHGIDDIVPNYISKSLGTKPIHVNICTESKCDYDGYLINGTTGPNLFSRRNEVIA